jgi:hypothetical protein
VVGARASRGRESAGVRTGEPVCGWPACIRCIDPVTMRLACRRFGSREAAKPRRERQWSVFGFRFSVFGFRFSVFGFRFSVFGFRFGEPRTGVRGCEAGEPVRELPACIRCIDPVATRLVCRQLVSREAAKGKAVAGFRFSVWRGADGSPRV